MCFKIFLSFLHFLYFLWISNYTIHRLRSTHGWGDFITRYFSASFLQVVFFYSLLVCVYIFLKNKKRVSSFIFSLMIILFISFGECIFLIEKIFEFKKITFVELCYLGFQTNSNEYVEVVGFGKTFIIIFSLIITFFVHYYFLSKVYKRNIKLKKTILFPIILVINFIPHHIKPLYFPPIGLSSILLTKYHLSYFIDTFSKLEDLDSNIKRPNFKIKKESGENSSLVLVVGESLSKDYMGLYRNIDTNPLLSKRNIITFNNAYSNHILTIKVLEMALTQSNQYNDLDYFNSNSLIDVINKSGGKSYWYSNQSTHGRMNAKVTYVANKSDKTFFTRDNSLGHSRVPDYKIVEELKKDIKNNAINFEKRNIIVLHMMGSHFWPCNRYPTTFRPDIKAKTIGECYIKSVIYNDYVLDEIINIFSKKNQPVSVVYFSDHGVKLTDNGEEKRSLSNYKQIMSEIPLMVFFNKKYKESFGNKVSNIKRNKNKIFTNDLIFDLSLGLLNINIESKGVKKEFDLSSQNFNLKMPLTNHGIHKVLNFK